MARRPGPPGAQRLQVPDLQPVPEVSPALPVQHGQVAGAAAGTQITAKNVATGVVRPAISPAREGASQRVDGREGDAIDVAVGELTPYPLSASVSQVNGYL